MTIDYEQYLGIPFAHDGATPNEGFNCWSLVRYLYAKHLHIHLDTVPFDGRDIASCVHAIQTGKHVYNEVSKPTEFDILLMSLRNAPCHTGMFINNTHLIHAVDGYGVIITKRDQLVHIGYQPLGVYRCPQ